MSHTTKIKSVAIRSISAVREAVKRLQAQGVQCELVENQRPRMYYNNQHGVCPYVLKLQGRYDVGLDRQEDGSYVPVFDSWEGDISKQIGVSAKGLSGEEEQAANIGRFMQEYGRAVTMEAAMAQNLMLESETRDEQGTYHLAFVENAY